MAIHIEKGGPFEWLFEKLVNSDDYNHLDEMAGLRKYDSGLPVNLWLDDSSRYKRSGHFKRIKFQGDYGNKLTSNNLFTMTISSNPEIPKVQQSKVKLPAKDVKAIRTFVINNKDLLSNLADQDISFAEFIKQMKI
jgi:hypothetical protein